MQISIIIPVHNDAAELRKTLEGIAATTGPGDCEVIVVDDLSPRPVVAFGNEIIIRNTKRIGVGPSRHIGAMRSTADWLCFLDSHMRFEPDWVTKAMEVIRQGESSTLYCATSAQALAENTSIAGKPSICFGADFHVHGPHPKHGKMQTFDAIWAERKPEENPEIHCVMGGAYFMHRFEFFRLDPLRYLRTWGMDEEMLSLKTWLSGGKVKLMSHVRIGHVYRTSKRLPFILYEWEKFYNKIFAICTLLPYAMATKLVRLLPAGPNKNKAVQLINTNWNIVEVERSRNAHIFVRDFSWFLERWGLSFPQ